MVRVCVFFTCLALTFSMLYAAPGKSGDQQQLPWKTREDFKKDEPNILRKIAWFETNPFHNNVKDTISYVLLWIKLVPYIKVNLESEHLSLLFEGKDYQYTSLFTLVFMFANAAYLIEHPDFKSEDIQAIKETMRSLVEFYENLTTLKKDSFFEPLEVLKEKTASGELGEFLLKLTIEESGFE